MTRLDYWRVPKMEEAMVRTVGSTNTDIHSTWSHKKWRQIPKQWKAYRTNKPPIFYSYSSQAFVDHHGICRYIIAIYRIYSSHLVYSTNANIHSSHKNQFLLWKVAMEDSPGAPCLAGFRVITRAPRCANVKMFGELVGDGWRMFGKCCEKLTLPLSL